jgi:hypothetical protein
MERKSVLREQYAIQLNQGLHEPEVISPLRASIDPRFSSLLTRATASRDRFSQQKVSPTDLVHSPSVITVNPNAWSPETSTTKINTKNPEV